MAKGSPFEFYKKQRKMKKSELAKQLREKQVEQEVKDLKRSLDRIKDDAIIDDYIMCDGCGERHISQKELDTIVSECSSADEFFIALDDMAEKQMKKHNLN